MLSIRACFEKSLTCLNRRKALPSAVDLGVDEERLVAWRKLGGGDLERVLASGAVALLDAQWIISHAEAGGVLNHRQALPEEAFLSLADLVEATGEYDLPVVALSYPWLTKDHPDPRGANLARVARALKALVAEVDGDGCFTRLGIFWDFGSLHQHPDPSNGVMRTEEQNALFKQGLGCLGTLYSHHNCAAADLLPGGPQAKRVVALLVGAGHQRERVLRPRLVLHRKFLGEPDQELCFVARHRPVA